VFSDTLIGAQNLLVILSLTMWNEQSDLMRYKLTIEPAQPSLTW
jgi:hypothetical protein